MRAIRAAPSDAGVSDAGLMGDAAPPADSGPGRDSGTVAPPADAGADTDAGTRPTGGVACGDTECALPGGACRASCRSDGEPAPACIDAPMGWETGDCPGDEPDFPLVVAHCDGPEDCGSDEACLVLSGSLGNYARCFCQRGDDHPCVPRSSYPLCHSLSDCPGWARACETNFDLLDGFYRTCVE